MALTHLVTGGAGFIGRWLAGLLLERPADRVVVLDDFSNAHPRNLAAWAEHPDLVVVRGNVADGATLDALWQAHGPFDTVYHLAASIRVQDSIDDPRTTFHNDTIGSFELLERCRQQYFRDNGGDMPRPFRRAE